MGPRSRFDIGEIGRCRTAALGGHKLVCEHGDYERIAYNSCRDRHCPKCQALAQEKWIAARSRRILAIGHFHVVFTLPAELRALARLHPAVVYQAMLRAVADTLLELGRTRKGLTFGLTLILHTWTREQGFHPHVHVLVSTGGLSLDGGSFIRLKHRYLFPLKMLGDVFRGKVLAALGAARDTGKFSERTEAAYAGLIAQVKEKRWLAYVKKPFRKSTHVLHYLGRYTHRVGIANFPPPEAPVTWLEQQMRACPICGGMVRRIRLEPTAPRAPPEGDAPC